eukprot:g1739.t1
MGWRSWNCYHGSVSQTLMEGIMDRMANKSRSVDGVPTSLKDLGYNNCGLDDNWQQCGAGVDKSFHDADGNPIVNTKTFPDMKAMTDHGHELGLRVGWYMNNCICSEHMFKDQDAIAKHMQGSVDAIIKYGFDGVKLDGCGQFRNLTWWYGLMNATGKPILIENCHWGGTVPNTTSGDGPCSGTTPVSDCPYNFFRTSGDISNNWGSMTRNLATTTKYQGDPPLARPGTWAYPDMMEVGRMASPAEDRTHFGAWVITSSPLILGYDLNDDSVTDKIWSVISNKEAIAINQAWAGHPGRLVKQFNPGNHTPTGDKYASAESCDSGSAEQKGWAFDAASGRVTAGAGQCLDGSSASELRIKACDGSAAQKFAYDTTKKTLTTTAADEAELREVNAAGVLEAFPLKAGTKCVDVYNFNGPVVQLYNCNNGKNQQFDFNSDGTLRDGNGHCIAASPTAPSGGGGSGGFQLWSKKQPGGALAVLLFNDNDDGTSVAAELDLAELTGSATAKYTLRDVWQRKDRGTVSGSFKTLALGSHDSELLMLTPQ